MRQTCTYYSIIMHVSIPICVLSILFLFHPLIHVSSSSFPHPSTTYLCRSYSCFIQSNNIAVRLMSALFLHTINVASQGLFLSDSCWRNGTLNRTSARIWFINIFRFQVCVYIYLHSLSALLVLTQCPTISKEISHSDYMNKHPGTMPPCIRKLFSSQLRRVIANFLCINLQLRKRVSLHTLSFFYCERITHLLLTNLSLEMKVGTTCCKHFIQPYHRNLVNNMNKMFL